jgi:glycosyltransferase involved in cell wall biosynthesis
VKGKGYQEILLPLADDAKELGFESDFRPVDEVNANTTQTTAEMHHWYNSGSYIVCASRSEGTPNTSLEGAACGCVLVTTKVGNALEWGRDGENMLFADRNREAFLEALLLARDNRERLSAAGAAEMRNKWAYGEPANRAAVFYWLFRQIIENDARDLKPFSYLDVPVGVSE